MATSNCRMCLKSIRKIKGTEMTTLYKQEVKRTMVQIKKMVDVK